MWGMSKSGKLKLVAASLAALAVAGGGAAFAATKVLSPREESQAVLDDAAKQLGVTPGALSDALKKALENRIDDAVADGRLTKAQGDELKERIESSELPFPLLGLGLGPGLHLKHFAAPFAKFDAAPAYLGLSESELASRLAQGKTLAQIAKARGKSVDGLVDALVQAAEKRIDEAVANGRLTKSQADDLKSGLRERMTRIVNGEDFGFRRFRFFAPGFGLPKPDLFPPRSRFDHDFWPRPGRSA
jgi:polyhydroxyalkanoate synthesis regulator phasin